MKKSTLIQLSTLSLLIVLVFSCQEIGNDMKTGLLEDFEETNYAYFETTDLPQHFENESVRIRRIGEEITKSDSNNAKVNLGRVLFYDNNLSNNGALSCASCHQQSKAFCDGKALSQGLFNEQTTRNSMGLANIGFQNRFFWGITTRDLVEAVMMPVQNHLEMGILKLENLPPKLNELEYYPNLAEKAFDAPNLTEENIAEALAMFVASMISYSSKFDKGHATNFSNFTLAEKRGMELFEGKAFCFHCHQGTDLGPQWRNEVSIGLAPEEGTSEFVKTKVPSLRNIAFTAPYMHDGRFETLMDVVNHYNSGIQFHEELDWILKISFNGDEARRLNLTEDEKEDLVKFLETLSDYNFINDARFSNPFN